MKTKKIIGMLLITVLFTGLSTINVLAASFGGGKPPALTLTAPSSVDEDELFLVTVTSRGEPIQNAKIKFLNQTQSTNAQGQAWLHAPLVDTNLTETLSASKKDYKPAREDILIVNLG